MRKPGAFEQYRHRENSFPSSWFRIAYDVLKGLLPARGYKESLKILQLAARETEIGVDSALRVLLGSDEPLTAKEVKAVVCSAQEIPPATHRNIALSLRLRSHRAANDR